MKNRLLLLSTTLIFSVCMTAKGTDTPVDYVNPLTGTMSTRELSSGNLYPAIALPWGMNFWTPQTGQMGDGWAYTYTDRKIRGFKETHQPSPWINDYGAFSLMPMTGRPVFDEEQRASWFSHLAEDARPYYYKVYLADYHVTTEITPTSRAAAFRFSFARGDSAYVAVDAFNKGSWVKIIPSERKIIGYTTNNDGGVPDNFKNYFVIVFDKPFTYTATTFDGKTLGSEQEAKGEHAGGILGFGTQGGTVNAKVASSFISTGQAERNLGEVQDKSFERIVAEGRQQWNETLGKIEIDDDNTDHLRTFYTCLYRSLLFPRSFYETDDRGKMVHYSPFNGKVCNGYMHTDFGVWDVFRALFPLLNLAYPAENEKIQASFANMYRESGFLPEWVSPGHRGCMVGNNSASVVADAYLKGLRGYDIGTLWEAVVHGAHSVHPTVSSTGRLGYEYYDKLGYVPCDKGINESAARTLEYAYDDWCIYQLGRALGKPEKEIGIYRKHALNYRNLFDKNIRLMRGRNADGSFASPFNPLKWGDAFTEGNSWHYTWSVFHDPQGLISLMGGKTNFNRMLDSIFVQAPLYDDSYYGGVIHEIREMQLMNFGQYAHGNQPIQHALYLYDYSGQPWKSQYWITEVMNRLYHATPDGYCGDEDNGQTSAWFIFSAMGFYPVCPGSNQYALGTPFFRHILLHLENRKTVDIIADGLSSDNRYIRSMTVNGMPYTKNFLTHDDLMSGATIHFEMSSTPNMSRGVTTADFPYSLSSDRNNKMK